MDEDVVEDRPRPPSRRRRWIVALCATLLIALVGAEIAASRAIGAKLKKTVADKLHARLELGTVVYVPPYGAWIWGATIKPDEQTFPEPLFKVDRVKVSLAELPLGGGDKPVIISSLIMNGPEVSLRPGEVQDVKKPAATQENKPPRKFSGVLRLRKVGIYEGRIAYIDPQKPGPPTVWENLNLELETEQQSVSGYAFRILSRAAPLADVSAAGTLDVDTLDLDVRSLILKARVEPEPARSPLPQAVQKFLKDYRVTGTMALDGSGKLPLRDMKRSSFSANVTLQDGMAQVARPAIALDTARASLACAKAPDGPVNVKVQKLDLTGGGRNVLIDRGQVSIDPTAGTWRVADLEGNITFKRPPRSAGAATLRAPLAAALAPKVAGAGDGDGDDDDAEEEPLPPGQNKLDRYQIEGRGDFSAALSGPLKLNGRKPLEAIEHEVILHPRRMAFLPKKFADRITDITGGEVRLAAGMIVFQDLAGKYGDDQLVLRAARIPLEGMPKLVQWNEISGSVTFHGPLRPYTPKLDKILRALNPDGPFIIAGSWTIDKRAGDRPPLRKSAYDLIISSDTGSFTLAGGHLPLRKIRGDASVTPAGVNLHGAEADLLGGRVAAVGQWTRGLGETTLDTYDGELTLRDVDLSQIQREAREAEGKPVATTKGTGGKQFRGRVYGQATFSGALPEGRDEKIKGLKAAGEFEVVDGAMFELPVLREVHGQVKGGKETVTTGDAAAVFELADGNLQLRDAGVSAQVIGLQGGGRIGLPGGELELHVVAAPLADWRDNLERTKIPIVSDVAGAVAGGIQKLLNTATGTLLYEFRVGGTLKQPDVKTVPTPVLSDAAAFVFGKMLTPRKEKERPLDWLKREQPRAETR